MTRRLISAALCFVLLLGLLPGTALAAGEDEYSQEAVYSRIIAKKEDYPDNTPWTNANQYMSKVLGGGLGCVAFAYILSDAAFGDLPARTSYDIEYDKLRAGDILRINNDTHSVVVLEVREDVVVVAEGNINAAVRWGRELSKERVLAASYWTTRYPAASGETPYRYGDVDGNDQVNARDRTILARYLAKWNGYGEDVINRAAADVNGDGQVNARDRTILARHLAKWRGYETLPLLDQRYAVLFVSDPDTDAGALVWTAKGSAVERPAAPTRSGYVFLGWYTSREGGERYDFSRPVTGPLTLYAHWTPNPGPGEDFGPLN